MRHRVAGKVLNADTQHRLALRRNLSRSLFLHGRIVTTIAKAKATRRFTEKLITRARRALAAKAAGDTAKWLHQVRVLARDVKDKDVLRKLLAEVAPRANRPGGYTRIVRDWKNQVGDNAPRAIFELVDRVVEEPAGDDDAAAEKGKKGKAKGKAKQPTPSSKDGGSKGKGKKAAAAEPAEAE
jgi:large subunit ribosomal protein L17